MRGWTSPVSSNTSQVLKHDRVDECLVLKIVVGRTGPGYHVAGPLERWQQVCNAQRFRQNPLEMCIGAKIKIDRGRQQVKELGRSHMTRPQ